MDAKEINKSMMFELDQYRQRHGALDGPSGKPFAALDDTQVSLRARTPAESKNDAPTRIFEPTQLPEHGSMKTSLDDQSKSVTDKPSLSDLPNWQVYYKELYEENERLRSRDDKQKEEVRLLKAQLEMERRGSRELKTEKANYYAKRSQLEELFLACIDEVRKDIHRRKAVTLARDGNLNSSLHAKKASKFQDTLDTAIKTSSSQPVTSARWLTCSSQTRMSCCSCMRSCSLGNSIRKTW